MLIFKEEAYLAYEGWLIRVARTPSDKIGEFYNIPIKYIAAESYSAYVNMQDVDTWPDANGYQHRDAVELKALKVEFETRAMMTNITFSELMRNIAAQYNVPKARQFYMQAYVPEYDNYFEWQMGYLADFQPQMYYAENSLKKNPIIQYNPIRLAFIGGVYRG